MKQSINKKWLFLVPALLLAIVIGIGSYMRYADADAGAVTLSKIDYDNMEITLNANNNAIIYYSTNRSKWYEADGAFAIDNASDESSDGSSEKASTITYDISWISATGSTKLYFRGNVDTTTLSVVIPANNKKFKAKFDKANGDFDFDNTEDVDIIRWRKSTDYTWGYIWADRSKPTGNLDSDDSKKYGLTATVQSLDDFEKNVIPNLRVKGTKLIFQTVPVIGEGEDQGIRPSKEVSVKIPAKPSAPNIKVNIKKLTVNTTAKHQWVITTGAIANVSEKEWLACTKTMDLSTIASKAVAGTEAQTVYFRTAATSKNCASKITAVTIPARAEKPTTAVVTSFTTPATAKAKAKASVMFTNVPSEGYEYTIIKNGMALNEKTAAWKTIKTAKTLKFTEKSLPTGSKIYVRVKGVNPNVSKGIALKLPSLVYESTPIGTYPTYTAPATSN